MTPRSYSSISPSRWDNLRATAASLLGWQIPGDYGSARLGNTTVLLSYSATAQELTISFASEPDPATLRTLDAWVQMVPA